MTERAEWENKSPEQMEELESSGEDQRQYLRFLAKTDLYFMAKGVLGYKDVNVDTHGAYCKFFSEEPKLRRMGLMPRAHLKTTLGTISDSVRLAVADPDEMRLLVLNETFDGAADMLDEVKSHFEKNAMLRWLFPEVIPERFTGPGITWGYGYATLVRSTGYKEATFTAGGVGTALVGGHYPRIKCDDLIGFEAMYSEAKMQEAIRFQKTLEPLLVDQHRDIIDWNGTRWRLNDLYQYVMEFYGDRLAVFAREAIENGEIIFPQKHTWEEYNTLQSEAPETWYAQYCNNPVAAGQTDFPTGAIREFRFSADGASVELLQPTKRVGWKLTALDKVMAVDPNGGRPNAPDEAAISVTGLTPDDDVVVLEEWGARPSPSELVDQVFDVARRWGVRVCGIEEVAQQTTKHYFDKKVEETDYHIRTVPLKPGTKESKERRIRRKLEPIIRSKRLYMLPTQQKLRRQIDLYPNVKNDDRIESLANCADLWRRPLREEDEEENSKVLSLTLASRNRRTGY